MKARTAAAARIRLRRLGSKVRQIGQARGRAKAPSAWAIRPAPALGKTAVAVSTQEDAKPELLRHSLQSDGNFGLGNQASHR